jgi:precorrin-6A/cobalt-precorrin-6A reductase
MILLLGGTSETVGIATRLAELGYKLLVSTATDAEQATGSHPNISRRTGRLGCEEMVALISELGIRAIVDVTHPYASEAHVVSQQAADLTGIKRLAYVRPSTTLASEQVMFALSHEDAAGLAFADGRSVLLTTGSRNLDPYVRESLRTGVPLVARVLDHPESIRACRNAGIQDDRMILGRGPFSVEANRQAIQHHHIGTLVTKDSGAAGGVDAKLEAARLEGCRVIMVQRPSPPDDSCGTIDDLLARVAEVLPHPPD